MNFHLNKKFIPKEKEKDGKLEKNHSNCFLAVLRSESRNDMIQLNIYCDFLQLKQIRNLCDFANRIMLRIKVKKKIDSGREEIASKSAFDVHVLA